jgi:hypothetical protein
MSPSFGGLISGGKEEHEKSVEKLEFTNDRNSDYQIEYKKYSDEPDLIKLRTDFKLYTIVEKAKSDFEKVLLIQSWVNSRWKHDGNNTPEKMTLITYLNKLKKAKGLGVLNIVWSHRNP